MKHPKRGSAKESKSIQHKKITRYKNGGYVEEEYPMDGVTVISADSKGWFEKFAKSFIREAKFPPLIKTKSYNGYDIEDIKKFLSKEQYSEFCNWFSGKTGGIHKGKYLCYEWDFRKFLDHIGFSIG